MICPFSGPGDEQKDKSHSPSPLQAMLFYQDTSKTKLDIMVWPKPLVSFAAHCIGAGAVSLACGGLFHLEY